MLAGWLRRFKERPWQSTNLLDLLGDMIPLNTSSRADTLGLESLIVGTAAAPLSHILR